MGWLVLDIWKHSNCTCCQVQSLLVSCYADESLVLTLLLSRWMKWEPCCNNQYWAWRFWYLASLSNYINVILVQFINILWTIHFYELNGWLYCHWLSCWLSCVPWHELSKICVLVLTVYKWIISGSTKFVWTPNKRGILIQVHWHMWLIKKDHQQLILPKMDLPGMTIVCQDKKMKTKTKPRK